MKPDARLIHDNFIARKHEYDGKETALAQPVQLPSGTVVKDNEANGIVNGQFLLSRLVPCGGTEIAIEERQLTQAIL